jgi:hypothetical protein
LKEEEEEEEEDDLISVTASNYLPCDFISIISYMPGNNAGNNFPEVISVLFSHSCECFQVIQNETLSRTLLVSVIFDHMRQMWYMFHHFWGWGQNHLAKSFVQKDTLL